MTQLFTRMMNLVIMTSLILGVLALRIGFYQVCG